MTWTLAAITVVEIGTMCLSHSVTGKQLTETTCNDASQPVSTPLAHVKPQQPVQSISFGHSKDTHRH